MQLIEKIVRWVMVIMKTMISKAKKLLSILEEIEKPEETEEEKKARLKKQRKKWNPYPRKDKPKCEAIDTHPPAIVREAPAKPKSSVIKGRAPAVIGMENETEFEDMDQKELVTIYQSLSGKSSLSPADQSTLERAQEEIKRRLEGTNKPAKKLKFFKDRMYY